MSGACGSIQVSETGLCSLPSAIVISRHIAQLELRNCLPKMFSLLNERGKPFCPSA